MKNKSEEFLNKTFKSKTSGYFKVVDYINANNILVQFLDTGFVVRTARRELLKGCVKDPSLFDIYAGKVIRSSSSGDFIITEYRNCKHIKIRFLDTGYETVRQIKEVRSGSVKDPTVERLVFGFGVNDADYNVYTYENGVQSVCPAYAVWIGIIERGSQSYKNTPRGYENTAVSEDFKYFSKFRDWLLNVQPNKNWQQCYADKDILSNGLKIYSPDTLVFVSRQVNNFILARENDRGSFMIGVRKCKRSSKFYAHCSNTFSHGSGHLGSFSTELEAHKAWQAKKHEYACQLADLQEDPRVAEALRQRYAPDKDWTTR